MDLSAAVWRKSTRSDSNGQCVEVARNLPELVAMRDSKDRSGPALVFPSSAWTDFLGGIKAGEFDL